MEKKNKASKSRGLILVMKYDKESILRTVSF